MSRSSFTHLAELMNSVFMRSPNAQRLSNSLRIVSSYSSGTNLSASSASSTCFW